MSSISTRSEMDLSTTLRIARKSQRPWTRELTTAIIVGEDRLDRVSVTSLSCGRAWTLAQIRRAERDIRAALRSAGGAA